ncbi:nuclear receptor subfamily 1 group I member 2 isoform X1 [Seriola aureovittata]|uniref:nuclear receptor subfamily 1 group I member 2 isoform X1 n=1 Tax=Seriola aureovittata TaxID=2871759 RepID=UPI0024BE4983|nr:nuclear receptor subfamily 1 group I member 2 isoform X1 [Seriola aureovittata]
MSKKPTGAETISEALMRQNEEETVSEDEEPRACGVCGDQAKGYHFNALTCEGCKGFFRRAIKRSTQLRCPFLNKCSITKNNRRSCQACRLRKCQAIGMRKEMVMSEKEVLERRIRIKKKKMLDAPIQLSSQQKETIQELLCGHRRTFDSAFSSFSGFRPMDRIILSVSEYNQPTREPFNPLTNCPTNICTKTSKSATGPRTSSCANFLSSSSFCGSFEKQKNREGEEVTKSIIFTALPHVTDLTTYMIQDIISFSKSLQDFRSLTMGDQIALLKGATFEIMQIRFNMVFNAKTNIWECGHITYCIDDAVRAGFQPLLLEPLFKFHHTLRTLGLQEEEYVLMQAMSLFSPDRPGVQQHSVIDELQENLALTLKTWIDCKRTGPEKHLLYPKVVACLTEMRTMTEEYSKQVLQIQDIQPDDISPLILEVVSRNPCDDF